MKVNVALLLFNLLYLNFCVAQKTDESAAKDITTLSLEELMNLPITVGSQKSLSINETPGSITLITDEMIRSSGVRDLDELLMRVPGFDIANDYGNVLSFGVRGNWANEGKILVMIDGMIINETNYGSAPLSQRFPLTQIKQIEIIRGSGSVIYGGVAALAVISIKTKKGRDLNGAQVTTTSGISNNAFSRNNVELSLGKYYKNGLDLSVHAGYNQGNNSNRLYTGPTGDSLNFLKNSGIRSRYVNVNLAYKNLELHFMDEDFRIERTNDNSGDKYTYFSGTHVSANYTFKIKKLKIIPGVAARSQQPWNVLGGPSEIDKMRSYRLMANTKIQYEASKNFDMMAGGEYYTIQSKYVADGGPTFPNGSNTFQVNNVAAFAEAMYHRDKFNVNAGFRFDHHSTAGSAFVPRLAITKKLGIANFKATYSKAFKTPLIYNITLNQNIKPEHVTMLEFETSLKLTSDILLTVNLYDVKITESIVYNYDATTQVESYQNQGMTGTRGVETELKIAKEWGYITMNHSFYQPAYHDVMPFLVTGENNSFMGLPTQKFTVSSKVNVTKNLSINPSLIAIGKRSTYVYDSKSQANVPYVKDPFLGLNIFAVYENIFLDGLSVQAGVYDLFNQQLVYLPAYNSGINPQPAQGRELLLRINYRFKSSASAD